MHKTAQTKLKKGFTLIEMIGVLAIIAILVAAVAPRIFEAIQDSRVTSGTTYVKTVQNGLNKYFADIGSLKCLKDDSTLVNCDTLGQVLSYTKTSSNTGGYWVKFRGPYSDFKNTGAPVGDSMRVVSKAITGSNAVNSNTQYSLNGNPLIGNDVVTLELFGASQSEWEKFEAVLDQGQTPSILNGRVKYDTTAKVLRVYIAHK